MWIAGLRIPAWMFERWACARVRVAADAYADLAALMALAELVRDVAPASALPGVALTSPQFWSRERLDAPESRAACRNKSTCSQENPGRRPAARQRGLGCRQRHKPR